jgi:hypothetical protein
MRSKAANIALSHIKKQQADRESKYYANKSSICSPSVAELITSNMDAATENFLPPQCSLTHAFYNAFSRLLLKSVAFTLDGSNVRLDRNILICRFKSGFLSGNLSNSFFVAALFAQDHTQIKKPPH